VAHHLAHVIDDVMVLFDIFSGKNTPSFDVAAPNTKSRL
jgi:hypothetical protein